MLFLTHNNPNGQPSPTHSTSSIFEVGSLLCIPTRDHCPTIITLGHSNIFLNYVPEVNSSPCPTVPVCLNLHSVARMICDKWKSTNLSLFCLKHLSLLTMFRTKEKGNVVCKVSAWFCLSNSVPLIFFLSSHQVPFAWGHLHTLLPLPVTLCLIIVSLPWGQKRSYVIQHLTQGWHMVNKWHDGCSNTHV